MGRWHVGGDIVWEIGKRSFDSTLPADRDHYRRNDTTNALEAGLRFGYRPH